MHTETDPLIEVYSNPYARVSYTQIGKESNTSSQTANKSTKQKSNKRNPENRNVMQKRKDNYT